MIIVTFHMFRQTPEEREALKSIGCDDAVMSPARLQQLADRKKKLGTLDGSTVRLLEDNESKNPWPDWIESMLKSLGCQYDTLNQDYILHLNSEKAWKRMQHRLAKIEDLVVLEGGYFRLLRALWYGGWQWRALLKSTLDKRHAWSRMNITAIEDAPSLVFNSNDDIHGASDGEKF